MSLLPIALDAMGGDNVDPMGDIELIEGRRGRLHRRPVRVAAHADAHTGVVRPIH